MFFAGPARRVFYHRYFIRARGKRHVVGTRSVCAWVNHQVVPLLTNCAFAMQADCFMFPANAQVVHNMVSLALFNSLS